MLEDALRIATDNDYKFDLAVQLGQLEIALVGTEGRGSGGGKEIWGSVLREGEREGLGMRGGQEGRKGVRRGRGTVRCMTAGISFSGIEMREVGMKMQLCTSLSALHPVQGGYEHVPNPFLWPSLALEFPGNCGDGWQREQVEAAR